MNEKGDFAGTLPFAELKRRAYISTMSVARTRRGVFALEQGRMKLKIGTTDFGSLRETRSQSMTSFSGS
jgi:hypothetical protein